MESTVDFARGKPKMQTIHAPIPRKANARGVNVVDTYLHVQHGEHWHARTLSRHCNALTISFIVIMSLSARGKAPTYSACVTSTNGHRICVHALYKYTTMQWPNFILYLLILYMNSSVIGVEWIDNRTSLLHPVVYVCHRDSHLIVPSRYIILPAISWPSPRSSSF